MTLVENLDAAATGAKRSKAVPAGVLASAVGGLLCNEELDDPGTRRDVRLRG
jgi:hypothetical protein